MTIDITMPRLSDTMEQGTIIKWHVAQGDEVSAGDLLADVETDKATMEMQSFDDGTVAKIAVAEGTPVDVGTVVVVLLEEDESPGDAAPATGAAQPVVASPADDFQPAHDGHRKVTESATRAGARARGHPGHAVCASRASHARQWQCKPAQYLLRDYCGIGDKGRP